MLKFPRVSRVLLALGLVLVPPAPRTGRPVTADVGALTFAVTSTDDAPDAMSGDGLCASTAGGACTLRAAVQEANARLIGSTIRIILPAGRYLLTLGELDLITNTVLIRGVGPGTTAINAGGSSRVLHVFPLSHVAIGSLTVTGGRSRNSDAGGGILNEGHLDLLNTIVSASSSSDSGGGLANNGTLTVENSAIEGNAASYHGGGLANYGILRVTGSTIRDNRASLSGSGYGGGLDNYGTATVVNSIIISNAATYYGGGLHNTVGGTVTLTNSAILSNTVPYFGGGIDNSGTLILTNSAVRNNSSANIGGGLNNFGTLRVIGSAVTNNTASYQGGGINNYSQGDVFLANSAVTGNTAGEGGGLYNNGGAITLTRATIQGNTAVPSTTNGRGGGLYNEGGVVTLTSSAVLNNSNSEAGGGLAHGGGILTVTNSTISGNVAPQGAGLFVHTVCCGSPPRVIVTYSTISGNTAAQGGGLALYPGTPVILLGAILADNRPTNCAGLPPSEGQGYNLDSGASCGLSRPTDLANTDPLLDPPTFNGGPTPTQALLPGSPAINRGGSRANGCPASDQRGVSRPQGAGCDIGAYERVLSGEADLSDRSVGAE